MYCIYPSYNVSFSLFVIKRTVPSENNQSQINTASKPCLQVELGDENPLSAKSMKISGKNRTSQIIVYDHSFIPYL